MPKSVQRVLKRLKIIAIVIAIFAAIYLHISYNVNPVLKKAAQEEIRSLTTLAVNKAASDVMASDIAYIDLLKITRDSEDNIVMLEANAALINEIARRTVIQSQMNIRSIGEEGVKVPLGSLSGLAFLAGSGPDITIGVRPVGAVDMSYRSEFKSAGINQTRHSILLNIVCAVSLIMPGMNDSVEVKADVVLSESIIVGKIPEVYLGSSSDKKIDLVP